MVNNVYFIKQRTSYLYKNYTTGGRQSGWSKAKSFKRHCSGKSSSSSTSLFFSKSFSFSYIFSLVAAVGMVSPHQGRSSKSAHLLHPTQIHFSMIFRQGNAHVRCFTIIHQFSNPSLRCLSISLSNLQKRLEIKLYEETSDGLNLIIRGWW